ncbi:CGNR zinc finger domain-containing protein [Agreia sp. COWG]|uniref:CGNR zinc finger domain-containing protein n=1 Tax=Agreia sp. COWG TaxID=2773266 RepID=UPI001925FBE1
MTDTTSFRFDGGATWLNLMATRGQSFGPRPVERLSSLEAARSWLEQVGLAPADELSVDHLERLVALREALRVLAMAAVEGSEPALDAVARVHREAEGLSDISRKLDRSGAGVAVQFALGLIAVQALVSLRGPDRLLLKQCAEADCRWVFLDTSGRRHWCPSAGCANRGRVRAHRARRSTEKNDGHQRRQYQDGADDLTEREVLAQ